MVNKKRLIKLTRKLISIGSENPPGDESAIAGFTAGYLRRLKLRPKIYEFKKKRPNVVLVLAGRDKSRSLLITPHLDTVPAGKSWRLPPFAGRISRGRIYGLGATDCKGNLAAALEAINSLIEEDACLDYNLIFAATADEESGSKYGLIPLLAKGILRPTQAVVLDSDDFNIIVAQKGLLHLKVKLQGVRSHGAYPWRGKNAIEAAVNILQEVKKYKFASLKNRYLRPPTVNIGTIRGGDKVNIVADWCEFELDFRFLPGMSEEKILRDLKKIIRKHAPASALEIEGVQAPYTIDAGHPLVEGVSRAVKRFGRAPLIKGSEGATTITFFQDKNIPAIATGFGSAACAHAADEYVKIENLYKGAIVLEEFLKNYKFNTVI